MFCHDRVATCDFYISAKKFHRTTQDVADLILSPSVSNFNPSDRPSSPSVPLSRDVPTTRKENATIVFLERSNRPLVGKREREREGGGGMDPERGKEGEREGEGWRGERGREREGRGGMERGKRGRGEGSEGEEKV